MKKILIVVDYQFDFSSPQGALPVSNADIIAKNIQREINRNDYDAIIYTMDSHTPTQYEGSEEQTMFPNIHCEIGTKGWELFNITPRNPEIAIQMKIDFFENNATSTNIDKEFMFMKDKFDIWTGNKEYEEFFTKNFEQDTEINIVGVATNYCVFMNAMGYPQRGYKNVKLISDCIEGIKEFPNGEEDPSYGENIMTMIQNGIKIIDPKEV